MKNIASIAVVALLAACSDSATGPSSDSFPALPVTDIDMATLEGTMTFWEYEGAAGCFGTISDGETEVQLWMDAMSCGDEKIMENAQISLDVIYRSDNQYGPGKTYTIVAFNN